MWVEILCENGAIVSDAVFKMGSDDEKIKECLEKYYKGSFTTYEKFARGTYRFFNKTKIMTSLVECIRDNNLPEFTKIHKDTGIDLNNTIIVSWIWRRLKIKILINIAIFQKRYEILQYLVDNGVNVNHETEIYPLTFAVRHGDIKIVEILCNANADPNVEMFLISFDNNGVGKDMELRTPLDEAKNLGRNDIVEYLTAYQKSFKK